MVHELDKHVRKHKTYRLESWLFVSRVYTLALFASLLGVFFTSSMFLVVCFVGTILVTVWSLSRYTAEWTRIAKTHPDWDNLPEREESLLD